MITVEGLTRDYGQGRGVFSLAFSVGKGEVFGFLGPNGAGKTTAIRHLMGFLRPQKGGCTINGFNCWHNRAEIQKNLGYIPGEIAFMDDMSGSAFLQFYARHRGMKNNGRRQELQERFDIDPSGKLKKMSKGMKQKIGIIAALQHDPAVLILDEPTSGLDPLMQNRFIELILEEKKRGKTILMSSHMFEEVERTCDRVGIIRAGKMAAIDSVAALKSKQVKKYILSFESTAAAQRFAKEPLQVQSISENHVVVLVRNNLREMLAILRQYPVTNLTTPGQSLEEIFLQYYGGDEK